MIYLLTEQNFMISVGKREGTYEMKTIRIVAAIIMASFVICSRCYPLDSVVTIPAEDPAGVTLELPAGTYVAQIESGAVTLHFPIHPNYCWLYAVLIGTGVEGGQDEANIGSLYVDPEPKVFTQTETEKAALEALKEDKKGTYIAFELEEKDTVRFWVSDYDYSDNSGSEKVRVYSAEKVPEKESEKE